MGVFDLLLEPELFKDVKGNETGAKLLPTVSLVLESKARTHDKFLRSKGNIESGVTGSSLHSAWLAGHIHEMFDALPIQRLRA